MGKTSTGIEQLTEQLQSRQLPSVHLWKPERVGKIDIHIAYNGDWYYQGSYIQRPELVRLFSSVLWRENENYFLVTPAEKLQISVEDAPFVTTALEIIEERSLQFLIFTTNVDDKVIAGAENPITPRYSIVQNQSIPYIHIRRQLLARINRPVYYQLADHCTQRGDHYGVYSGDQFFYLETN